MSRVAVVATIVTSMIALSPPSLAASDGEIVSLGDKMSGAFKCSTYAQLLHEQKEQQRLFQISVLRISPGSDDPNCDCATAALRPRYAARD